LRDELRCLAEIVNAVSQEQRDARERREERRDRDPARRRSLDCPSTVVVSARELGIESVPVRVVETADPVEHMLSAALHRRHLTPSQRAAVALELDEHRVEREAALARRRAGKKLVATLPQGPERTREIVARRAGVSPRLVQDVARVRDGDTEAFEAVKRGELPAHRAAAKIRRELKRRSLAPAPPLPAGPYPVLYADPPWRSQVPGSDWAPEAHYDTMTVEEIKALAVPAADDAILFLWAVNNLLPEALEVMDAWGFQYRTNLAWVKDWIGLGFWARNRHELLLVGRRGDFPLPHPEDRPDSVLEAPRTRHSEKPAGFYELIERMYPDQPKLELFARKTRPGWSAWGNEAAA
jgi:N6-adenosine-specific RNA methylase IME4